MAKCLFLRALYKLVNKSYIIGVILQELYYRSYIIGVIFWELYYRSYIKGVVLKELYYRSYIIGVITQPNLSKHNLSNPVKTQILWLQFKLNLWKPKMNGYNQSPISTNLLYEPRILDKNLSLGVAICLNVVSIESLGLDTGKE